MLRASERSERNAPRREEAVSGVTAPIHTRVTHRPCAVSTVWGMTSLAEQLHPSNTGRALADLRTTAAHKMTEPGSMYWPSRVVSAPFRRLWFDITIEGEEHLPVDGPVVLAPNHISFLDSFLLMYALPRKVVFLGKAEYLDSWKTRLFPAAGMIPVDRSGKGIATSLRQAGEILDDGGVIGIFPEGTRARDGFVHQGHTGAAHLALRHNAALVPVGIVGTDIAQPPGASHPRRDVKITLRFGKAVDLAAITAEAQGRSAIRQQATDELMQHVARLAGRPYSPTLLAPSVTAAA